MSKVIVCVDGSDEVAVYWTMTDCEWYATVKFVLQQPDPRVQRRREHLTWRLAIYVQRHNNIIEVVD